MIFLGAGASTPFGIPTAKTLTTEIRELLAKEHLELLNDITAFWKGIYQREPNYENILTFLMGLTDSRKIPRESVIQAFVRDFPKHKANYGNIVDEMYSRIVDYCNAPFVSGEKCLPSMKLEGIFERTYDAFTLLGNEVVFTTNYDPSIEIWCQKRNILIYDSTNPTQNPEIKEVLPINESSVTIGDTDVYWHEKYRPRLKIVRLHGSVWVYETEKKKKIKMNRPRDKLLFTDWYTHLDKKPHLIFPGQESVLASGEWDMLYQYFKKMLQGVCLVIGYSFQDDLINRAFLDNLNKETLKTIGILNSHPEEAIKDLFWDQDIPNEKVVSIPTEFGTDQALDEIYWKWKVNVLHSSFGGSASSYLSAVRKEMKRYLE